MIKYSWPTGTPSQLGKLIKLFNSILITQLYTLSNIKMAVNILPNFCCQWPTSPGNSFFLYLRYQLLVHAGVQADAFSAGGLDQSGNMLL